MRNENPPPLLIEKYRYFFLLSKEENDVLSIATKSLVTFYISDDKKGCEISKYNNNRIDEH